MESRFKGGMEIFTNPAFCVKPRLSHLRTRLECCEKTECITKPTISGLRAQKKRAIVGGRRCVVTIFCFSFPFEKRLERTENFRPRPNTKRFFLHDYSDVMSECRRTF